MLLLLFYRSPIFCTVDLIEQEAPGASQYLLLNPFAVILQQTRHAVLGPGHPNAWEASGASGALIVVPIALTVAVGIAGWPVFRRLAPRIAEEL
ncbi:MAG: hypothetical protein H0T43_02130 [Solirubrobacterales bacterium]|nr:hypothetical protein [Solirubrobacterales bacterium]